MLFLVLGSTLSPCLGYHERARFLFFDAVRRERSRDRVLCKHGLRRRSAMVRSPVASVSAYGGRHCALGAAVVLSILIGLLTHVYIKRHRRGTDFTTDINMG
jgi:hypothetical protein